MVDQKPEASPTQREVIKGPEGIINLAQRFRWDCCEPKENGKTKTNLESIQESVEALRKEGLLEEPNKVLDSIQQIRESANVIYKYIYPQNEGMPETVGDFEHPLHGDFETAEPLPKEKGTLLDKPYYHGIDPFYNGIGTKDNYSGHNDHVMAVAARLFTGLVKLKKEGKTNPELLNQFNDFFGDGWQEKELTLDDFKSLVAMCAFHEVGEWWIKKYWEEGLITQRQQFDSKVARGIAARDIKVDPTLRNIVKAWPAEQRAKGVNKMRPIIEMVEKATSGLGIAIDYDPEDEASEFYVYFKGGKREDTEFRSKNKLLQATGEKPWILAALYKAADFSQCASPSYLRRVDYKTDDQTPAAARQEALLVLFEEFYTYKPGALPPSWWAKQEDVFTIRSFWLNFIQPYFANDKVLQILDYCFRGKNPYREKIGELEKRIVD